MTFLFNTTRWILRLRPLFSRGDLRLHRVQNSSTCRCSITSTMASSLPDITASPAAGQHITHEGKEYQTIKEGLAHILIPASASTTPKTAPKNDNQAQSVFYNPIQQFNRDLSVLAIKVYGEEIVARKRLRNSHGHKHKRKEKKRKHEEGSSKEGGPRKAGKLENGLANPTAASEIHGKDAATAGVETKIDKQVLEPHSEDTKPTDSEAQLSEIQPTSEEKPKDLKESDPPQSTEAQNEGLTTREDGDGIQNKASEEQASTIPAPATGPPQSTEGKSEGLDTMKNGDIENKSSGEQASTIQAPSKVSQPKFTILDALSATGLRALRYAHEIPFTTSITANDLQPTAVKTIDMNVSHNKLEGKINITTGNAMAHMYARIGEDKKERPTWAKKYDVIDLDPYGTAAPFLDAAVQAVRDDGGLLCVTCTDAGVWASNAYPEKAYSLYGGTTVKGVHRHEGGLRLILHSIATTAARYGLAIEPLLSLSIDFYARVFVRIYRSAADVKFMAGKTMMVYNCDSGCGAWSTQMLARNRLVPNKSGSGHYWKHTKSLGTSSGENCPHCGTKTHIGGPMYAGPLHSPKFIQKILNELPKISKETYQTTTRIEGMLTVALEEILPPPEDTNSPTATSKTNKYDPAIIDPYQFLFKPDVISKVLHCVTPHENALRGALRHMGYRVTRSHTKPGSIKTDAPWEVIWEVMREWVKQKHPVKEGAVKPNTAGYHILGLDKKDKEEAETEKANNKEEQAASDGPAKPEEKPEEGSKEKPEPKVVFDETLGRETDKKKLVRYQLNPRENWGPMQRAKGP